MTAVFSPPVSAQEQPINKNAPQVETIGKASEFAVSLYKQGKNDEARVVLERELLKKDVDGKLKDSVEYLVKFPYELAHLYLGNSYNGEFKDVEEALPLLNYLYDKSESNKGDSNPKTLQLALDLVQCHYELGQYDQAYNLLKHTHGSISFNQKFLMFKADVLKALIAIELSQVKDAYIGFDRAIEISEGLKSPQVITFLNKLGKAFESINDYTRSRKAFEIAISHSKDIHGPDDDHTLELEQNLASVEKKNESRRTSSLDEIIELKDSDLEKLPREKLATYAYQLQNVALTDKRNGDYLKAEPAMLRSIKLLRMSKVPVARQKASMLLNAMGEIYEKNRKYDEALSMYKQSVELWKDKKEKYYVLTIMHNYKHLLNKVGKREEAKLVAAQIKKARAGDPHPRYNNALIYLMPTIPSSKVDKVTVW